MTLRLGTEVDGGGSFMLPLDAVTQKLAFLGRTGSGKTYAAMKLAECMLEERAQVIALDPVGVWHGLRLGPRPFDIPIFGGLHADVPLDPGAGALVADVLIDRRISAVLDVSQMVGTEPAKFATAFVEQFFQRQKATPSAVHIFLEECQEFIPQNTTKGLGEEMMLHQFQRLIKIGRNFSIGVTMISQRPQEVNKKALNQTEGLFALQMTGPHERKTIKSWVHDKTSDDGPDVMEVLPKLHVGEAHVWSPQWLKYRGIVKIGKKRTADVSSTLAVGGATRTVELSTIDLDELREDMAVLIEKAKEEDPDLLKRRCVELEKRLKVAETRGTEPKVMTRVPEEIRYVADEGGFRLLEEEVERELGRLATDVGNEILKSRAYVKMEVRRCITTTLNKISTAEALDRLRPVEKSNGATVVSGAVEDLRKEGLRARVQENIKRVRAKGEETGVTMPAGARRMLVALAQAGSALSPRQLGIRTGVKWKKSGAFNKNLALMRSEGWVEGFGSAGMTITEEGYAALGQYEELPRGKDLFDYWAQELSSGAGRILIALREVYPDGLSSQQITRRVQMSDTSGTFAKYMATLRALELIEKAGGRVRMSPELS